jgi:hypothetical protein
MCHVVVRDLKCDSLFSNKIKTKTKCITKMNLIKYEGGLSFVVTDVEILIDK